jgi:hypothetical protein
MYLKESRVLTPLGLGVALLLLIACDAGAASRWMPPSGWKVVVGPTAKVDTEHRRDVTSELDRIGYGDVNASGRECIVCLAEDYPEERTSNTRLWGTVTHLAARGWSLTAQVAGTDLGGGRGYSGSRDEFVSVRSTVTQMAILVGWERALRVRGGPSLNFVVVESGGPLSHRRATRPGLTGELGARGRVAGRSFIEAVWQARLVATGDLGSISLGSGAANFSTNDLSFSNDVISVGLGVDF